MHHAALLRAMKCGVSYPQLMSAAATFRLGI
jgi:hypothetical protein